MGQLATFVEQNGELWKNHLQDLAECFSIAVPPPIDPGLSHPVVYGGSKNLDDGLSSNIRATDHGQANHTCLELGKQAD